MSEDEQSGSNFDTRNNIRRMKLLLLAMATLQPGERWSTDNRDFAVAVDHMAAKGNPFAKEFHVLTNVAGRHSPDFGEILSHARSWGAITRRTHSYEWMDINLSPNRLQEMAQEFTNEELGFAAALVVEFWNISHGITDETAARV
jgi:hypothetical protein